MNFGYPEIIYQFNKISFSGSLVEQLNQIDINELILNSEKYIDEFGNFNESFINKTSKKYTNSSFKSEMLSDETLSTTTLKSISGARGKILTESKKYIGIPYTFGSKDPSTGFDCSGYVSYVYKKAIGYSLPTGSKKQFSQGGGRLVNYDQLKPGDLMFFSHNGRSVQHVGIYINNNQFIHAPRTGRRVSIDKVGRYWKQKFVKGRTIVE